MILGNMPLSSDKLNIFSNGATISCFRLFSIKLFKLSKPLLVLLGSCSIIRTIFSLLMSDHLTSIVSIKNLKLCKCVPVQTRDTRTKNVNALKNSLKQIHWCEVVEDNSPSKSMYNLHKRLTHEIDHFTPLKTYCIDSKSQARTLANG